MDFTTFIQAMARSRVLVAACVLFAGAAGFLTSMMLPRTYTSDAVVLVGSALSTTNIDSGQLEASRRLSETYARIATTRPVLQRVIDRLELDLTPLELREEHLEVNTVSEPSIILVSASMPTPEDASIVANAIVTELIQASPAGSDQQRQEFLERQLSTLQDEITNVEDELLQLAAVGDPSDAQQDRQAQLQVHLVDLQGTYAALLGEAAEPASNTLTLIEEAVPSTTPASPQPLRNAALAAGLGLLFGVLLAVLRDQWTRPRHDAEEPEGLAVDLRSVGKDVG